MSLTRNDFTQRGLHTNSTGKEKIAKMIGHKITNLLTTLIPPISLKWKFHWLPLLLRPRWKFQVRMLMYTKMQLGHHAEQKEL